jgi:hypothetical protein
MENSIAFSGSFLLPNILSVTIDGYGTFAKTANIVLRLSFADQGKQTSIFHFFPFVANKLKFAFFVFHLQQTNGRCRFPLVPFSVTRCVLSITLYFNVAFCFLVVRFCCEPLREAGRGHV